LMWFWFPARVLHDWFECPTWAHHLCRSL